IATPGAAAVAIDDATAALADLAAHAAAAVARNSAFESSAGSRRGHAGGRAGRPGQRLIAAISARHAFANADSKLRVAAEERSHVRRAAGAFFAGTTTDTAT